MSNPICTLDECSNELTMSNEFELLTEQVPSGAVYFCTSLHATIWSITKDEDTNG
jgi:hypothetical protein